MIIIIMSMGDFKTFSSVDKRNIILRVNNMGGLLPVAPVSRHVAQKFKNERKRRKKSFTPPKLKSRRTRSRFPLLGKRKPIFLIIPQSSLVQSGMSECLNLLLFAEKNPNHVSFLQHSPTKTVFLRLTITTTTSLFNRPRRPRLLWAVQEDLPGDKLSSSSSHNHHQTRFTAWANPHFPAAFLSSGQQVVQPAQPDGQQT